MNAEGRTEIVAVGIVFSNRLAVDASARRRMVEVVAVNVLIAGLWCIERRIVTVIHKSVVSSAVPKTSEQGLVVVRSNWRLISASSLSSKASAFRCLSD